MRWHDTVTILRAGATGTDPYGGPSTEPDWDSPIETPDVPCSIQYFRSLEEDMDRETVVGRWFGWFPPGTDLLSTDRVSWRGRTLTVDGEVAPWVHKGQLHHLEVPLREIA
jgi:hypothetical protein